MFLVNAELVWMSDAERSNYAHLLAAMHLSVKKELSARASTLALEPIAESSRESPAAAAGADAQRSPLPSASASDLVDQLVQAVLRTRRGGGSRDARFGAFADADPRDSLRLPDKFEPLLLFSNERYHQLLRR